MPEDPTQPPAKGDSEHARVLAEVLQDQARRKEARAATEAVDRAAGTDRTFYLQVGLLVTGTFFLYLFFFSPTWVAPTAADPITADQVEDGLRAQIFFTAKKVVDFQLREGRLPETAEELDFPRPGIVYQRVDAETFRIQGESGDLALSYVSSESLDDFLGEAVAVFGGRM